jgi:hypothetical protein
MAAMVEYGYAALDFNNCLTLEDSLLLDSMDAFGQEQEPFLDQGGQQWDEYSYYQMGSPEVSSPLASPRQ